MASSTRLKGFDIFHTKEYVRHLKLRTETYLPFLTNASAMPMIFSSVKRSFILFGLPSPCIVYTPSFMEIILCSAYRFSIISARTTSPILGLRGGTSITLSRPFSKNGRMLNPRTMNVTLFLPSSLNKRLISCMNRWLLTLFSIGLVFIVLWCRVTILLPLCRGGMRVCVSVCAQALWLLFRKYSYVSSCRTSA